MPTPPEPVEQEPVPVDAFQTKVVDRYQLTIGVNRQNVPPEMLSLSRSASFLNPGYIRGVEPAARAEIPPCALRNGLTAAVLPDSRS